MLRLDAPQRRARAASARWDIHKIRGAAELTQAPAGFAFKAYEIEASSPGSWANRTRLSIRYRLRGMSGRSEIDLAIEAPGEPPEYLSGLILERPGNADDDPLQRQVERRSALIRLNPVLADAIAPTATGPSRLDWQVLLDGGDDGEAPDSSSYSEALKDLNEENEIAIVALPDLHRDLEASDAQQLLCELIAEADAHRDRLVLVDAPPGLHFMDWLRGLRELVQGPELRSAALYHPWLGVPDPLGGVANPIKPIPPCGHVAGVVSRLDRERGPHYTPANAQIFEAVDLAQRLEAEELLRLNASAVNLLRCTPGYGLQVWGGSTLARTAAPDVTRRDLIADHFTAYRRLIHRLVRAIRRVAEPLVFHTNGPELWLAFVRAVTTVLLEAYRNGALKGERPEEAFRVRCDEKTNPPEEQELGRCVCEIALAPAVPMEFIVLRVALGGEGNLEVFES